MGNPIRVTVALDENTYELLRKLTDRSQSETVRRALKFYHEFREFERVGDKLKTYVELLASGEHVILDIDHLVAFLKLVKDSEEFWEMHKEIARAHAEEFRDMSVGDILKRLEACNLLHVLAAKDEFTVVVDNELLRDFVKVMLEEMLSERGYEICSSVTKIRIKPRKS